MARGISGARRCDDVQRIGHPGPEAAGAGAIAAGLRPTAVSQQEVLR
ncbi:MAG: hypothetical protein J2P38_00615 [Candidatus Dormibacteraeota bacterium]|nr:hypothetical protein [Candidatus Dormibacteraeota bacterium]